MISTLNSIHSKLTRITSGGKLIREIDGLRFMAILPVLIQHYAERFERNVPLKVVPGSLDDNVSFVASRGFLGVYIFFVISGFVLALPFAAHRFQGKNKVKISSYFWRRLTRLEPPYIIWMSLFFIVYVIHNHFSFIEYLPHYLANITYTHTLIYNHWSPFNPPTWTLEIEIQFYLLAPFLSILFFRIRNKSYRRIFNVLIITVLVLVQQYFKLYLNPYSFTILGHLQYFLIGFILVDFYLNDWNEIKPSKIFDVLGLISWISLIYFWSWNYELLSRVLVMLSLFLFFISVFKSHYLNAFVTNRWIMVIGGMCYTIYLIHLPFAEFLIRFTKNIRITDSYTVNLATQLAIFLPVILCISAFFYIWVERPFMDKNWPQNLVIKLKSFF